MLVEEPLALVDYLVLVHPQTLADVPEWYRGEALLAVAARVGTTRLIDNTPARRRPRRRCARRLLRRVARPGRGLRAGMPVAPVTLPRRLSAPAPGWTTSADVVVVGSGIAGLTGALRLRERVDRVLLVTKAVRRRRLDAVGAGRHRRRARTRRTPRRSTCDDTLVAGVGLCDPAAVRVLVTEGPDAVRELIALGAEFDRDAGRRDHADPRGRPPPRPDRARRRRRHRRRDLARADRRASRRDDPGIEVIEHALVVDLLPDDDGARLRA